MLFLIYLQIVQDILNFCKHSILLDFPLPNFAQSYFLLYFCTRLIKKKENYT